MTTNGKTPLWTTEEDDQLIAEIKANNKISEIATNHNRSSNAIIMRMCLIAHRLINRGKSIQEAQKYVKLISELDIQNYIDNEASKKIKKLKLKENKIIDCKDKIKKKDIIIDKSISDTDKIIQLEEQYKKAFDLLNNKLIHLEEKHEKTHETMIQLMEKLGKLTGEIIHRDDNKKIKIRAKKQF